jgi:hypothetical protein
VGLGTLKAAELFEASHEFIPGAERLHKPSQQLLLLHTQYGLFCYNYYYCYYCYCRSQWPRGLGRRSSAARLLRLGFRIPPGAWMFICCECCVLSGRGLCDGLITRPEKFYPLWRVVACDQETSNMRRINPLLGCESTTTMGCNPRKTNIQTLLLLLLKCEFACNSAEILSLTF